MKVPSPFFTAIAAIVAMTASPAAAAENPECPRQQLTVEEATQAMRGIGRGRMSRSTERRLAEVVGQCQRSLGWSDAAAEMAIDILVARLGSEYSHSEALRRGATEEQLSALDARLSAVGFRVTIEGIESETADGEPLFAALRETGLADHRALSDILTWLSMRSRAEDRARAFAALP